MRPGDLSYSYSLCPCPVADAVRSLNPWQSRCTGSSRPAAAAAPVVSILVSRFDSRFSFLGAPAAAGRRPPPRRSFRFSFCRTYDRTYDYVYDYDYDYVYDYDYDYGYDRLYGGPPRDRIPRPPVRVWAPRRSARPSRMSHVAVRYQRLM